MMTHLLTITDRGVISIPAEIRRVWKVRRVLLTEVDGGVLLRPVPDDPIGATRGIFATASKTSDDMLAEDRAADRAKEDAWSSTRTA
jgi:bifunctional DNA-binding transcriptional regulator/antitoxin component of YhaV-PrlF toxin-antitoxin module